MSNRKQIANGIINRFLTEISLKNGIDLNEYSSSTACCIADWWLDWIHDWIEFMTGLGWDLDQKPQLRNLNRNLFPRTSTVKMNGVQCTEARYSSIYQDEQVSLKQWTLRSQNLSLELYSFKSISFMKIFHGVCWIFIDANVFRQLSERLNFLNFGWLLWW